MNRTLKKLLIISLFSGSLYSEIYAQKKLSITSFDFGPATDLANPAGFSLGFAQFEKICLFIDYLGVLDKDGFISHEISPKFGVYSTDEKILTFSVSVGLAMAFHAPQTHKDYYYSQKSDEFSPFAGIPVQARIDFAPRSRIGGGVKYAYVVSLTSSDENHSVLGFFLSIKLTKDLKD